MKEKALARLEPPITELGAQQQVVGGGAYREGAGIGIGAERLLLAMAVQSVG